MYQVLIKDGPKGDELEIHSPFSNDLKLDKGGIKKGINTFDSFNLSFLPNNPAFGKIKPLTTLIRVFDSQLNKNIFKGRVLIPTDQMESNGGFNCSYTCASDLSYLQDTIQKYAKIQDTTPEQFFKYLIDVHNSQIEEHKRFIVGVVNVTNNTDNVYRYVDDLATTWDTIQDKLISRLGGELRIREVNGVNYIDYLIEIGERTDTTIELSKNLISLSKSVDPTEIVTRLYPRGERLESEEETGSDASQPRLTISSVNGGRDYLDAPQELINEFGIIEKSKEWSEVTQPQILKSKGQQFLDEQKSAQTQYSLTAVDLSLIDMDIRRFEVANYYLLKNPVMGIDEELRIVGIGIDIIDVEMSELTIGDRFISLSQYQAELKKKNNALNDIADKTNSLIKRTNNLDKTTAGLGKELIESNKIISQQQQLIEDALRRIKELENGTDPERPIGKIIDVSEHQGQIDWVKVKADDIELAIIRVQDGSSYVDNYYRYNIQQCQQLNIPYAVYAFARYVNEADAGQEATDFYNRTKSISGTGKQPLFYMIDVEVATMENMRQGTEAWQNKMISFGISQTNQVAYIANHLYDQFNINVARFGSIVIPAYRSTPPDHPWDLWQYSDKGSVQGINGNVDMNKDPSERFKKQYLGR
ncbi:phage tail spike protein [Carnobacterium divergens]|uniref:phage tail spike protein n=1 Tax=Carnobacterium divergens TaxID=2748 RepID=UPI0007F39F29|nr:phage tail spike protein [Carnobacterium divergens]SBO17420.1 Phage minor structural, N-terminal region domain protein [Carnobacterium divergens]